MKLSPVLTTYNGCDVAVTYESKQDLWFELGEFGLKHYYFGYLQPLASAVYAMQMRGMPVDLGRMEEAKRERLAKMGRLRESLRGCAAIINEPDYNPNSNPQTAKLLREFGFHSGRETDKGAPKADKMEIVTALLKTAGTPVEAVFANIAEYRGESKDYGTFLAGPKAKPWLHIRPWSDGRIRTRFLVTTRTGRLQSRKWTTPWGVGPEFQNIPDDIRRIYCAPPGYEFIQADAAQLELVLMANAAGVRVWRRRQEHSHCQYGQRHAHHGGGSRPCPQGVGHKLPHPRKVPPSLRHYQEVCIRGQLLGRSPNYPGAASYRSAYPYTTVPSRSNYGFVSKLPSRNTNLA